MGSKDRKRQSSDRKQKTKKRRTISTSTLRPTQNSGYNMGQYQSENKKEFSSWVSDNETWKDDPEGLVYNDFDSQSNSPVRQESPLSSWVTQESPESEINEFTVE